MTLWDLCRYLFSDEDLIIKAKNDTLLYHGKSRTLLNSGIEFNVNIDDEILLLYAEEDDIIIIVDK